MLVLRVKKWTDLKHSPRRTEWEVGRRKLSPVSEHLPCILKDLQSVTTRIELTPPLRNKVATSLIRKCQMSRLVPHA